VVISSIDLSALTWSLEGWRQWEWELASAVETTVSRGCDVGPVPTPFPGSVRGALVAAGIVADPGIALRSRDSEFIENRHWVYRSTLPAELPAGPMRLVFDSLDGPCQVWVAGELRAESANTHVPLTVELGESETVRGAAIAIVFTTLPDELGQIGHTSSMRAWKPRFNFGWDWIPRVVQIGPARGGRAEIGRPRLFVSRIQAGFEPDGEDDGHTVGNGRLVVEGTAGARDRLALRVVSATGEVLDERHTVADDDGSFALQSGTMKVSSWWRTGTRYDAVVIAEHESGEESTSTPVGFRHVEWTHTAGAAHLSEPWLLHIDGAQVFLRGVNWVPLGADYADVALEEYRRRLETYVRLGVNIVRVWGGGSREHDVFYDLCDQFGLLVWQELPLSSSGIDNRPPDDDEFVAGLATIAAHYAARLHTHPSLLVWSGGNELSQAENGEPAPGSPLTFDHPALAAARDAIRAFDAQSKIVPTSPSGPRYVAEAAEFGQGLHHDVHGPWTARVDLDEWREYWAGDDAMLRSEVGVAGASGVELLEKHGIAGTGAADRIELWRHTSNWWIDRDDVPDGNLGDWVAQSQRGQADAIALAASASMDRFPSCGGFISWMGHDSFPCAVSLSLLDVDGRPKPAAEALGEVFRRVLPGERAWSQ